MHAKQLMKKGVMYLKEEEEVYEKGLEGEKGMI